MILLIPMFFISCRHQTLLERHWRLVRWFYIVSTDKRSQRVENAKVDTSEQLESIKENVKEDIRDRSDEDIEIVISDVS